MKEFQINSWNFEIDKDLANRVKLAYATKHIMPTKKKLFSVFELLKPEEVTVVFLGQDPYPGVNDAHGISFSVQRENNLPPSLKNIYIELENDLKIKRVNGDLTEIVKQGVLFMNTVLTVEVGKIKSHHNYGWQKLTNKVISDLSNKGNIIFVLLGAEAGKSLEFIDTRKNIIIKSSHPSPRGAEYGFFGSRIFSQINNNLIELGKSPIDWSK